MGHSSVCIFSAPYHGLTLSQLTEMLTTGSPVSAPPRPISTAFEPHMKVFIDAQDKYFIVHFITG
jgi:hypothetical protein